MEWTHGIPKDSPTVPCSAMDRGVWSGHMVIPWTVLLPHVVQYRTRDWGVWTHGNPMDSPIVPCSIVSLWDMLGLPNVFLMSYVGQFGSSK